MKRFVFLLPALLFVAVSCKQTYFIAEDDVYSSADPVALRPRSGDVKPEASYDGYVYQQENGNRAGYFDPNANQNVSGETRVINNYYIYDTPGMGWNGSRYRINRWNRPGVYVSYGWGPSWGWNSWGHNPWGPSWGWNSWGYNPWGPSWGPQPWGWNPYGYYHQPWGGNYGMWGYHGGGWGNPYSHGWGGHYGNGWGMHGWYSAPAGNSGGFGSGNNGVVAGSNGPRPTFAGNQNPVNMGVGRGNVSPIDASGRPNQQALVTNDVGGRGNNANVVSSGRDSRPNTSADRNSTNERPVLANGSSPWNPRVDAPARNNNQASGSNAGARPTGNNPNAVTVDRGNSNSSRPNSSASPSRPSSPSVSTPSNSRPSGTASPNTNRPSNTSPAPSSRPNTTSPSPSSRPNTSSPAPSRTPSSSSPSPSRTPSSSGSSGSSRPSGGSSGGSIGGGGSSGGSSGGGGRSGGSSGGSSGGGRPR